MIVALFQFNIFQTGYHIDNQFETCNIKNRFFMYIHDLFSVKTNLYCSLFSTPSKGVKFGYKYYCKKNFNSLLTDMIRHDTIVKTRFGQTCLLKFE